MMQLNFFFLFMFEKNLKKIWTFLKKEKIQIKLNTKCGGLYDTTVWIGIIIFAKVRIQGGCKLCDKSLIVSR